MTYPEVRSYALTMDKLDKWGAASRAIVAYQRSLPIDKLKNMPDPPPNLPHTFEAMANWTKTNYPTHVRLVTRAGLPFKEYLIMNFALLAAVGIESMQERGVQPPPGTFVNQANVQFCKTNKTKITAMFAEFQQVLMGHK